MSHSIKKQLKDLRRIAPSETWFSAHRELLLSQIRAQGGEKKDKIDISSFAYWRDQLRQMFFVLETVLTSIGSAIYARGLTSFVLVFVLLLASGGYVVTAAEGSVPGETLYNVKVAVENLRLKMATSSKSKVELQTEFAVRRLDELSKLTARDGQRLPEAEILVSQFETSVKNIAATVNEVSSASPERSLEIAKIVDEKTEQYKHSLQVTGEASRSADFSKRVSKALSVINKANTEALKVIVSKGEGAEPEKIAEKLNDKIKQAEEKLRLADAKLEGGVKVSISIEVKDKSADVKINLAEAKKKITEGDYQAALVILDKAEDMVEEVADSAEVAVGENLGQGTENQEGEVKGENTESNESEVSPSSSSELPDANSQKQ